VTPSREPGGSPVTSVRRSSRGPSALVVVVAVVAVLAVAVGLAVVSGPAPSPSSAAVASVPPSAVPPTGTPSESASPLATPVPPPVRTVLVLRGVRGPAGALGALTGCAQLRRATGQPSAVIQGSAVDAAADASARSDGWLFVPPGIQGTTKAWLGDDVVALALAAGAPAVAVGVDGAVWLGGPAGATRWQPVATPAGRTAWTMTNDEISGRGRCGTWTVPTLIDGRRSVSCAGLPVPACLRDAETVAGQMPAASLAPDLVVVGDVCSGACRQPVAMAASLGDRAAGPVGIVGLALVVGGAATSVPPSDPIPEPMLDAIARPALPLPVGGEKAKGNACDETLVGELGGAAWDPEVAWVSSIPVIWPTGTAVRFTPSLEMRYPGGAASALAGDSVRLTGSLDVKRAVFNACAVAIAGRPSSAPSISPAP
jgi:hypothetical protein